MGFSVKIADVLTKMYCVVTNFKLLRRPVDGS